MKRKTIFIAASALAMTAAAIAYAADGGYMPGLPSPAPAGAPPGRGGPAARPPAAATAQNSAPGSPQAASPVVTSSPDVLESAVSREMNDMSNEAARTVMKNEINSRVVDSQVTLMKKQAELARAAADVAKARGDTTAANKQTALDAGATPGQPQQATLPAMSVVWIAGAADNPEAQIKIAKYGSVVVRKGSRVPATVNMTVDKIDSHGILIKDATGQLYPISFGG